MSSCKQRLHDLLPGTEQWLHLLSSCGRKGVGEADWQHAPSLLCSWESARPGSALTVVGRPGPQALEQFLRSCRMPFFYFSFTYEPCSEVLLVGGGGMGTALKFYLPLNIHQNSPLPLFLCTTLAPCRTHTSGLPRAVYGI